MKETDIKDTSLDAVRSTYVLPDIGISSEKMEDIVASYKAEHAKKEWTEEEISQIKLYKWILKHPDFVFSENGVSSLDYSAIQNEDFRNDFINLCVEFERRKGLYNYIVLNGLADNDPVKCYAWYSFVKSSESKFGFNFIDSYIEYNENHFAIWPADKNKILLAKDYILLKEHGGITRWSGKTEKALNKGVNEYDMPRGEQSKGMTIKDVVINYIRLFKNILNGHNLLTFDNLLYHVMKFTEETVEIAEFSVSPRNIYQWTLFEMNRMNWKYPSNKSRGRHQKVYIEPGYTKDVYTDYRNRMKKLRIRNAIIMCKSLNQPLTEDNIITQYALANVRLRKKGDLVIERRIQKAEFNKLLKEMLDDKDNPDWKGLIENKVRKQHKQQARAEWHDLLLTDMSLTYKSFVTKYPHWKDSVTESTFNKRKTKLKKSLQTELDYRIQL